MVEPGGVVAPESPSSSGERNDAGAVNDRIAEKWFVRERTWVSKTLGNNGGRKVNRLFGFVQGCTLGSAIVGLSMATL